MPTTIHRPVLTAPAFSGGESIGCFRNDIRCSRCAQLVGSSRLHQPDAAVHFGIRKGFPDHRLSIAQSFIDGSVVVAASHHDPPRWRRLSSKYLFQDSGPHRRKRPVILTNTAGRSPGHYRSTTLRMATLARARSAQSGTRHARRFRAAISMISSARKAARRFLSRAYWSLSDWSAPTSTA